MNNDLINKEDCSCSVTDFGQLAGEIIVKKKIDGDLEIDQEARRFDNNWGWARIAIWFLLICHFFPSLTWSVLGRDPHLHVYCISLRTFLFIKQMYKCVQIHQINPL